MGLLKPVKRKRARLRSHSVLRCLAAGHQVTWCKGLCKAVDGVGQCGRPAPHTLRGRTQLAIERCNERAKRERIATIEREGSK
jgi:hypothetical protein